MSSAPCRDRACPTGPVARACRCRRRPRRNALPGILRVGDPQPATRNPQPATRNPQPATRNPQPATRNPQPASRITHHASRITRRAARVCTRCGRIPHPQVSFRHAAKRMVGAWADSDVRGRVDVSTGMGWHSELRAKTNGTSIDAGLRSAGRRGSTEFVGHGSSSRLWRAPAVCTNPIT
ncbi:hypothetical protein P3T22_003288 [Paraburkholderia sp. GAS348]